MKQITTDERGGLPSASIAWRIRNCPGSRHCPPVETSSPIAEQGTLIHTAIETEDLSGLDDEDTKIAEGILRIIGEFYDHWNAGNPPGSEVKDYREKRFWITDSNGENIWSGKLDRLWVCGNRAALCDAKSGFIMAKPAASNFQIRTQVLCVSDNFPKVTEITGSIAQYRLKASSSSCVYTREDMKYAKHELLMSDWVSKNEDAPRSAGEWCRYCPGISDCRTAGAYSLLTPTTLALTPDSSKDDVEAKVNALSLPQLAKLHSYSTITIKTLEAVKERLKALPDDELNAIGLMKGKPAKVAEVTNIDGAREIFVGKNHLVTKEEFDAHVSLTLGKLEKIAVPRLAKRAEMSQKLAKEQLRDALKHCIEYSEKAASLAPFVPESKQIQE